MTLLQYYNHHFISLREHLRRARNRSTSIVIHQIRVDIKNLRAIFDLLETMHNDKRKDEKSIIFSGNLFRTAGKVREEQVNNNFIAKYRFSSPPEKFREYLISRKRAAFRQYHTSLNELDLNQFIAKDREFKESIKASPRNETILKSQKFIRKGIKTVKKLYPDLTTNHLHKIRKNLKAVNTIASFVCSIDSDKKLNKLLARIEPVETLIGVWHNRMVLINSIKQFIKKNEIAPETSELLILISKLKKRNKKTINQVDARISKLFQ